MTTLEKLLHCLIISTKNEVKSTCHNTGDAGDAGDAVAMHIKSQPLKRKNIDEDDDDEDYKYNQTKKWCIATSIATYNDEMDDEYYAYCADTEYDDDPYY